MNFHQKLKEMANSEQKTVPASFSQRIDDTLENLPQKRKPWKTIRRIGGSIAAAIAIMIALPNLSPTIAYAMGTLPVVGELFQAITFRTYEVQDGKNQVSIQVPQVTTQSENDAGAQSINEQVAEYTSRLIADYESEMHADGYFNLNVDWDVVTNTENWFTLEVRTAVIMAGAAEEVRFYHIDVPTGEAKTLSDLFAEDFDYVSVISEELKEQMRQRMEDNPQEYYWLEGTTEVAQWQFQAISEDHNFYFNENGELVIPFNEYEVGPGSTGSPEFVIQSPEVYEHLLYHP